MCINYPLLQGQWEPQEKEQGQERQEGKEGSRFPGVSGVMGRF